MKPNYKATLNASFTGYIVQAIVNNFVPLLFVTFNTAYNIPYTKITFLITFNFLLQLGIDLASAFLLDKIGYRISAVLAHIFAAAGLISLTVLPELLSDPFTGITISVILYAIGGGLLEVVVSPIVESCPNDRKDRTMSILHSFYCWGSVGVVALSTLYFTLFGTENWKYLAVFWAAIPAVNAVVFTKVPLANLSDEENDPIPLRGLLKNKTFWLFAVVILCAGASEASVAQWSSAFAETGLGVSKAVGDLAGPALFAVAMGVVRTVYGKHGKGHSLEKLMLISSLLCIASYLVMALIPHPSVALAGMTLCGASVGILWPGTYSSAASSVKGGGNAMFALLALAGDIGCTAGPTLVGQVSGLFGDNLKAGILAAMIFPVILAAAMLLRLKKNPRSPR